MTDIDKTLAERGARYGNFAEHAVIAQGLKGVMWRTPGWACLAPDQAQALEVIVDKIARILNGDPNYPDNWHDIIGYAKLIEKRLQAEAPAPCESPAQWNDWAGGLSPVESDTVVEIRTRGEISRVECAKHLRWLHLDDNGDIVAWRLA